jgi:hypothetical protein
MGCGEIVLALAPGLLLSLLAIFRVFFVAHFLFLRHASCSRQLIEASRIMHHGVCPGLWEFDAVVFRVFTCLRGGVCQLRL